MIIDLHVHEYLFSACSHMSLEDAVIQARRLGLDGLCITDHGSMDIQHAVDLQALGFPVFVGVEMTTTQGDMVALGLKSLPTRQPSAQAFADHVSRQGGFCFAAHPFRAYGGMGRYVHTIKNMGGVEVFNGANSTGANAKALQACRQLGLIPVAGSDAHWTDAVGAYATWFPEPIHTMDDLVLALQSGKGRPVVRDKNGYRTPDELQSI